MLPDGNPCGDDTLLEEQVLNLLDKTLERGDHVLLESWLNGGRKVQTSLFENSLKFPSEGSKVSLQALKASRPSELTFLISLSTILNIDELDADQLLKKYCKQQFLLSRELTIRALELESYEVLENVRDFYYTQQQQLWKILQELLRLDKDEDHSSCSLARKNVQYLQQNNLVETLLARITILQNWQPNIPCKSQLASFPGSTPPFALLDTRCSDFMGRHMLASAEFAANELERALETLILLLYTHKGLTQLQLECLMTTAARDHYATPRGCIQLVHSILGQDNRPLNVPFLVYNTAGLPTVQVAYQKLGEQLSMKYVIILAESLQFWRALTPTGDWDQRDTHPLLENYVQSDMARFTVSLQVVLENLPKKGKCDARKVHTVILFLWGLFLETFGSPRRAETVQRPADFVAWISDSSDCGARESSRGSSNTGPISEKLLTLTTSAGAVESLVNILDCVIGLGASIGGGGLSSVMSHKGPGPKGIESKEEGHTVDLNLVCTVLQETVNVIICTVCLAHGSIDHLMNISLLIELTHRCNEDLCETFWCEWQKQRKQSERQMSPGNSSYPLCLLLEILLENTPHDPTYLFAILTSLACSPSKCVIILEILNQQVAMVKWTPVSDILFLETDSGAFHEYDDRDPRWLDVFAWKEGKSTFIGANVMCSASSSRSKRGPTGLKDIIDPQKGSRGIVCDVAVDGKEELLVRWDDQILWWGVVLDAIGRASLAASAVTNESSGASIPTSSASADAIKTSVTLNLLSTLISKQRLITSFYLESKCEQLMLHSALIDIGGSHLFDTLSQANETVERILSDPQRAFLRLIGDDVGIPPDEVAKLITLLQEYSKKHGAALFSLIAQPSSGDLSTRHPSSVSFMMADSIASAVLVLSRSLSTTDQVAGPRRRMDTVVNFVFLSSLQFLASFASSSPSWASATSMALCGRFDPHGPGCFAEVIYQLTTQRNETLSSAVSNSNRITLETFSLLLSLLQSLDDSNVPVNQSTQHLLVSMVTYLTGVFIDLEHAPGGDDPTRSSRFLGWRGRLTQKCLSILRLILSRTASPLVKSATLTEDGWRGRDSLFNSIGELLLSRLVHDPRLMRSILRVATNISLSAVLSTPSMQVAAPATGTATRVFRAPITLALRASDAILPIDYSQAFQSLNPLEVSTCLSITSSALEMLSLALDLQAKHHPEQLPVLASVLFSRVDLPDAAGADKSLRECAYVTLLCGLLQSPDKLAVGIVDQLEMRRRAFRVLTDVVLLMSRRVTHPSEPAPCLSDCMEASSLRELCISLCDTMELSAALGDKRGSVAAFDLLLAIGQEQPLTLVALFSAKKDSEGLGTALSPVASATVGESKVGMLLTALNLLLTHAKELYKSHPLLLHKIYEFIALLWRSASAVPPLGMVAIKLIQIESKFFSLITVPLSSNLPAAPTLISPTAVSRTLSLALRESSNDSEVSGLSVLRAAIGGADVSQMLLDKKKDLRLLEKSTNEYCHTLLAHSSALQILALERHGHLFSMDAATARKADTEMRTYFLNATETNRFFNWLKTYMQVDINDNIGEEVTREARGVGIDLSSLIYHGSHITGSIIGTRTQFGNLYVYDVHNLHKKVVSVFEGRCLAIDEGTASADVASLLDTWTKLERKVHTLNLQWSLSDAQMMLLQSWKVFIQLFVLPGSSARQMAYKAQYELSSRSSGIAGDGWTPPGSPAAGSLSPSFDPSTGSPSGPSGSNFAGDRRSYELVHEISKHLVSTTAPVPGTEGIEEPTTVLTAISIGAARVLLEKSELLASMLHHQLREVLLRTSDPRRSQVDSRHLGSSRLSPVKMRSLLEILSKCYTAIVAGLDDHPVSLMQKMSGAFISKAGQQETQPQHLKRSIQRQLFTSLILTLRGIVQLDSAPLFPGRGRVVDEEETNSSSLSPTSLVRLQVFRSAVSVVKQESEALNGPDMGPGSLFVIALRLMKCCLPVNLAGLSLSTAQAWRAETNRLDSSLSLMLVGLLKSLSDSAQQQNLPVVDHDYSLWGQNTVCGAGGSALADTPLGDRSATYSSTSSSSALFAVLDVMHGGMSSGVLPLASVYKLPTEFSALGVFQELQRVLISQPLSRSAALMGYSSRTGEISDLTNCWERAVDLVSLIIDLSAPERQLNSTVQIDQERVREREGMRELVLEGSVSFLKTYGHLLMLPLTQSFIHSDSKVSRLTLRRVQLCRCSVSLFNSMTKQFRLWRAVLPALFDASLTEMLRAAAVYITILTDVKQEDKDQAQPMHKEEAEEEKELVSTPGGGIASKRMSGSFDYSSCPRTIFDHVIAVSEDEKKDAAIILSSKKRRSILSRLPGTALSGVGQVPPPTAPAANRKVGQRVTFDDVTYYKSAPRFPSEGGSGEIKPPGPPSLGAVGSGGSRDSSDIARLSAAFVLRMDREVLSSLVSILVFLKEVTPEQADLGNIDVSAVCVGSKVYYFSRAYEQATRSIQLLEGMIVAINPCEALQGNKRFMYEGKDHFEVVLANGAREFDVSPDDVVYPAAPMIRYQRLVIPYDNCDENTYVGGTDEYLFSSPNGVVVSVGKDLLSQCSAGNEVWTGTGLEIIAQGALAPVTLLNQKCLEGEESITTAHLLRILAFATSKTTHTRLSESASTAAFSISPNTPQSPRSSSAPFLEVERDLETLSGLASWLCLGGLSHHAHSFARRRCSASFAYIGGRPGMIEQLEYLKSFSIGDAKVMSPPQWLVSPEWKQYSECLLIASEEVIERLRDKAQTPVATPEAPPIEPKKGTKIGLRTKLHFVSTPEEL